jgi:hypothetical protein
MPYRLVEVDNLIWRALPFVGVMFVLAGAKTIWEHFGSLPPLVTAVIGLTALACGARVLLLMRVEFNEHRQHFLDSQADGTKAQASPRFSLPRRAPR